MTESDRDAGCSFVFDPQDWEAQTGIESPLVEKDLDEDGVWHCPHDRHDGAQQCLFHLPPDEKDDKTVRDRLLEQIAKPGREPKQFIGAHFGRLDLDHAIIEGADNHPIDLRHTLFEDQASWTYAIVRQPLQLDGSTFEDAAIFTETAFENEVYFTKSRFSDRARFIEAHFGHGGWFYKAQFSRADFSRSIFDGPADFINSNFDRVHFREAVFRSRVDFDSTSFSHAMFHAVTFSGGVSFEDTQFPKRANFRRTRFGDFVSFESIRTTTDSTCIDLRDASVPRGRLIKSSEPEVVYDLKNARVGDVELGDGDRPKDLFDYYRLLNTTFDGFDFGAYRDALHRADWTLHETIQVPGLPTADEQPSAGTLENTYLKAKNGANSVGETKAAAEFFRKEMVYRRYQYLPQAKDSTRNIRSRLTAVGRWASNLLLDLTAGFGERPSRVIGVSLGVILVFAGLFSVMQISPPYGTPLGYLILSLESFVTLVLGGAENIPSPWIRLLAQSEGFIGAFLIALFVFTLTRSIHR